MLHELVQFLLDELSLCFFGTIQQQTTCPECHGKGKVIKNKCPKCNGQGYEHKRSKIEVKIPAGISSGQQVRIPN